MSNNFQMIVDYVQKEFSDHTETVRDEVEDILNLELGGISEILDKSQSPIEAKFGLQLYRSLNDTAQNIGFCIMESQKKIPVYDPVFPEVGQYYIADFLVTFQPEEGSNEQVELVIECDGHEYHERTKEQARKDRKRDRLMTYADCVVLRFTGSEIHDSCEECVLEVIEYLSELENRAREQPKK